MALERAKTPKRKPVRTKERRNIWLLVISALLIIGSIILFTPPQDKITQGLDIRGGLSVVLSANPDEGQEVTTEDMEQARTIIENRVNALGASEATVQVQGTDQILVQIPGLEDAEQALETIGSTGQLAFARLDSFTDDTVVQEIQNGNYGDNATIKDDFGYSFPAEEGKELKVDPSTYTTMFTGDNLDRVTVDRASQTSAYYAVNLDLDATATQAFADATRDLVVTKGQIVILLDNNVESAPAVQAIISDGNVSITGNYSADEAKAFQAVLESGSLPVNFEFSTSQVVGPTLGQDALYAGLIVVLIGLALVMLYLLFFYKGLGIITASAMLVFAVIYLGILAALSAFGLFSLSLAGIAGIVLTIGMAADSSILTVERFREEIRMGKSVRAASQSGVKHAIFTSIDADSVTLVSALCLFFLASAGVKGFGLTLSLGIFCDVAMMLLFKAPLIRLLAPRSIAKHPGFWGIKDCEAAAAGYEELAAAEGVPVAEAEAAEQMDPEESLEVIEEREGLAKGQAVAEEATKKIRGRFIKRDINFLGIRKIFLSIAAVAMVACLAVMGFKGFNFGIEFVGGSSVTYTNTGDVTTDQMRAAFEEVGEDDVSIQTTVTSGENGFLVRTANADAADMNTKANDVAEALGIASQDVGVDTIGPDWGASVINSSLLAFFVSLVLIIIYIGIRFEYKMGVIAVVALLHDLILVMGIYALVGREVNPNTIAALLTILGYSLYDTVVVFHRINDNMKAENIRCTFMTMANHSMNQVFVRTINTTLTSLVPVLAMLLFGGETLKDFAFAMVIGLVAGSYSSIAVATPLYSMWKTREKRYAKLAKKYGPEIGIFSFDAAYATGIVQVPVARIEAEKKAAVEAGRAAVADDGASGEGAQASGNSTKHEHRQQSRNHYGLPASKHKKGPKDVRRPDKTHKKGNS